ALRLARVSSPRMSPDGSRVAYLVAENKMEKDKPWKSVTHSWVTDFHGLSFSILFSATRYATREPSGDIRGEETRARRSASIVPNNFFLSLLLGVGASESCFAFPSCACTLVGAEVITETANRIAKKQSGDFLRIIAHTPLVKLNGKSAGEHGAQYTDTSAAVQSRRGSLSEWFTGHALPVTARTLIPYCKLGLSGFAWSCGTCNPSA